MTKTRSTKRALLMSTLALLMCMSMLVGSTMAWFTDSVTSTGNKIQAGTLKLDLELYNTDTKAYESIKTSKAPIFNHDKWEPGYTDVKLLKVENEGTLALKWYAKFVSTNAVTALADVIDVYVLPSETELSMPADRDLTGYEKVGTVREFINTIETTTKGTLEGGKSAYLGIALKMQETANNDYQGLTIGAFDIQILATQLSSESDSFDNTYDNKAVYDEEIQVEAQPWHELDAVHSDTLVDGGGYTYAADYQEVCLAGDADITIKGVTFQNGLTVYTNSTSAKGTITLEDCVIYLNDGNGNPSNSSLNMHYADYGLYVGAISPTVNYVFKNCTFTAYDSHIYTNNDKGYNVYIGGNYSADSITFEGCTFEKSSKHGIGCSFGYIPDQANNIATYYNLIVTGCNFVDWNNGNYNGAAIRGNVPADILTQFNKSINISGNTFGDNNGSTKANVAIDSWSGSWS